MNADQLTKLAIAGAMIFAAYKFGPAWAKAAALGVAGVAVAKQLPYVKDVV